MNTKKTCTFVRWGSAACASMALAVFARAEEGDAPVAESVAVSPVIESATVEPLADTVSALPAAAAAAAVVDTAPVPTEEPKDTLSVDFPDEDIRSILRNVADLFELNLVMPDTLQGRSSIKLRDVTWRSIFKYVLSPVGYTFVEKDNIVEIVTNASLAMEPVESKVYLLNYARAEDALTLINPLVNSGAGGRVQSDKRINALIISERPSRLPQIEAVLERLDQPTKQVMIESKFVEVTNRDLKNIGVNWASLNGYQVGASDLSVERSRDNLRSTGLSQSDQQGSTGSNETSTSVTTGTTPASALTTTATNGTTSAIDQITDLTRNNAINTITTSVFSAQDFNLLLSALKSNNETKLVSNPTVVTLNNIPASISIAEEFPIPSYTYNTERGTFEVSGFEYRPIGIILKVTPQVNERDFIRLSISPEVSSQAGSTTFGGASGAEIPIIATRKAETQVTIRNGYTMGIGGLVENVKTTGDTRVPVLGSIPGIGRLFRSNSNSENARNLLIFITAKTLDPDGAPIGEVFNPAITREMKIQEKDLPGYRDGSNPFYTPPPPKEKKTKGKKSAATDAPVAPDVSASGS